MTTAAQDWTTASAGRAFADAVARRDSRAVFATLAPDIVLHSAVTAAPFEGRDVVGEIYAGVTDAFDHVEVVDDFSAGDTYAFFWRGRIEGRFVEGADRLRLDEEGRVREITVLGRPLSGLATFVTAIGSRFARARRGDRVAAFLRATSRPLPPAFALLDPLTRWLARGGGGGRP
jgi:ketosteroid isomerase-like protein